MSYVIRAGCVIDGTRYDMNDPSDKVEALVATLDDQRRVDLLARGTIGEIDDETGELKLRPRRRLAPGVMSDPTMDIPTGEDDAKDDDGDDAGDRGGRRAQGGWGQGGQGGQGAVQTERPAKGSRGGAQASS